MNQITQAQFRVPYTREAVQAIKEGASAADLGWDQSFYERVCRERGIHPLAPSKPGAPLSFVVRPVIVDDVLRTGWGRYETRTVRFDLPEFKGGTREFSRELGRHSANLLLLMSRVPTGNYVDTRAFADATGITRNFSFEVVKTALRGLEASLIYTPLSIERAERKGSRLIMTRTMAPARVRVLAIGTVNFPAEVA